MLFPQTLLFTTQMTASKGQKRVTWSRFSDLELLFTSCRSRAQRITIVLQPEKHISGQLSIEKCNCKSAGLEFTQFLFSGKCLYFTLGIFLLHTEFWVHVWFLVFVCCYKCLFRLFLHLFYKCQPPVLASFVSADNPRFLWCVIFPLWLLERISLWISAVWLWLFFFVFVLLLVCWPSWIYKLIFFHQVWKISAVISSDSFSS